MNAAAARFEVLPGGRAEKPAEGDTSWLDAEPTETDNSPTSPWNPEHQLVGSLMWLPSDTVRRIAAVVPAAAIERPTTRWAYELITALAENPPRTNARVEANELAALFEDFIAPFAVLVTVPLAGAGEKAMAEAGE